MIKAMLSRFGRSAPPVGVSARGAGLSSYSGGRSTMFGLPAHPAASPMDAPSLTRYTVGQNPVTSNTSRQLGELNVPLGARAQLGMVQAGRKMKGAANALYDTLEGGMQAFESAPDRFAQMLKGAPNRLRGAARSGMDSVRNTIDRGISNVKRLFVEPEPAGRRRMTEDAYSRMVRGYGVEVDPRAARRAADQGPKMASNSSVTGGMANPPGPAATPGKPATAANAAIGSDNYSGPFTGALAAASPMAIGLGMGAIGGMTSYATGGNFLQGAALGAAGGFVGVKGAMYGARYAGKNMEPGMIKDAANSARSFFVGGGKMSGRSQGIANQRAAMLAGAGLSGMVFGGRRNHKRGFNSRRGNSF